MTRTFEEREGTGASLGYAMMLRKRGTKLIGNQSLSKRDGRESNFPTSIPSSTAAGRLDMRTWWHRLDKTEDPSHLSSTKDTLLWLAQSIV